MVLRFEHVYCLPFNPNSVIRVCSTYTHVQADFEKGTFALKICLGHCGCTWCALICAHASLSTVDVERDEDILVMSHLMCPD